jgi:hypothetical protein
MSYWYLSSINPNIVNMINMLSYQEATLCLPLHDDIVDKTNRLLVQHLDKWVDPHSQSERQLDKHHNIKISLHHRMHHMYHGSDRPNVVTMTTHLYQLQRRFVTLVPFNTQNPPCYNRIGFSIHVV